jgi:hypothetical protein
MSQEIAGSIQRITRPKQNTKPGNRHRTALLSGHMHRSYV